MKNKIIVIATLFCAIWSGAFALEVDVLSGGYKTISSGGSYVAHWTYVIGWYDNGTGYYSPSDEPGILKDEYQFDLAAANARWGSHSSAYSTLHDDYYFTYCTASCLATPSTMQFDLPW